MENKEIISNLEKIQTVFRDLLITEVSASKEINGDANEINDFLGLINSMIIYVSCLDD